MNPHAETRTATLTLPIRVSRTKKQDSDKLFSLNLNEYRNANHHTLNNAKANFKEMVTEQINKLPTFDVVSLSYGYVAYQSSDTNNICSIVDKFFADALVELGKLPDDSFDHVIDTRFTYLKTDRKNPHVIVTITGTIKEDTMQITLDDAEINEALDTYVRSLINVPEGKALEIDLKAGRGDNGNSAIVQIVNAGQPSSPETRAARAAPKGDERASDNVLADVKPKAETKATKPAPEKKPEPEAKPSISENPEDRKPPEEEAQIEEEEAPEADPNPMQGENLNHPGDSSTSTLFGGAAKAEETGTKEEEPAPTDQELEGSAPAATTEGPKPLFSFGS